MFCSNLSLPQVKLSGLEAKVVRALLQYLYTGKCLFALEDLNLGVEVCTIANACRECVCMDVRMLLGIVLHDKGDQSSISYLPYTVEKKRTFDAVFKLKVIDYASQYSIRVAVRKHEIDEKRVSEWKKQKEDLEKSPAKRKRLNGASSTTRQIKIADSVDR